MRIAPYTADQIDALQEIANVAIGQAGACLATMLDVYVSLSVPHSRIISVDELAGEVAGLIIYREELDPDHKHAALDIALHPDYQNQGLGSDALRALSQWLFARGHHRVTIDPGADNDRAVRSCMRAGFRKVGVMRRYERGADGTWHDCVLMELLDDDLTRV